MGMLSITYTLFLLNVLFLTSYGNLYSDDVMAEFMSRLDAQQRQIDVQQRQIDTQQRHSDVQERQINMLQDVINQQQAEIQLLTHKQTQNEADAEKSADRSTTWVTENGDDSPNNRRKRQLPTQGTVAFTAVLRHTVSNLELQQTIKFDTVKINVGNAYNPQLGTFVAPVSGIYVFHATVFSPLNHSASCRIAVNNAHNDIAMVYAHESTGSQMIVTELRQGDSVAIKNMNHKTYIAGDYNDWTTFSGFLLHDLSGANGSLANGTI